MEIDQMIKRLVTSSNDILSSLDQLHAQLQCMPSNGELATGQCANRKWVPICIEGGLNTAKVISAPNSGLLSELSLMQENIKHFATNTQNLHDADITLTMPTEQQTMQHPASEIRAETLNSPQTAKPRVLLVDDEPELVEVIDAYLGMDNIEVIPFTRSTDALTFFSENPAIFDLVITDHSMSEITGLELAQKISESRKDIPIIICSGHNDISPAIAHTEEQYHFMQKPFPMPELLTKVKSLVEEPEAC